MMSRDIEKIAQSLLKRMHLLPEQAAVLLDQSTDTESCRTLS